MTDIVADLIGPVLDCFLSQFIFKNPGAWGQPWHQDSFYFPFEPPRPIVGVWLAVTAATLENGCLHVLAGSNREPIHEHVPDRRPGANYGYVEITDHDMTGALPVLMEPGDLGLGLSSALATVNRHGPLTFGELAAAERISPPSVTSIVRKLEERGLVERCPDDRDRRVCRLRATAAGRRHIAAARARRTAWLTARVAELDEQGLSRLAAAVEVLEELIRAEVASA